MYGFATSVDMKVWKISSFLVLMLLNATTGEDTEVEDIGVHQLERLAELLTSKECENLLLALSETEEKMFQHLESLSPENNQLDLKPRARRALLSDADSEAECRMALTDWLLKHGEQTYYDRLSQALQHIGRTDVAIEVGKNINQDKSLNIQHYVEDYHKFVSSLSVPQAQPGAEDHVHAKPKTRKRKVRDLEWRDLDLIVQRAPLPPYRKGPLDVALPLAYGILLGFGGTLLAGVIIVLFNVCVFYRN